MMKWRNTEATLKELTEALSAGEKLMFFDTETTGLKFGEDRIIQLSGIKTDREFNIIGTFNEYSNPFPLVISLKITEITGIRNEDVKDARLEKDVLEDFLAWSDGCIYLAYNSPFDVGMCTGSMNNYGKEIAMRHFDVLKLARDVLANEKLSNHKLGTVAEFLNVVPEDAHFHDSLFDVQMTIEVFKALLKRIRNTGYESSEGKICPRIYAIRPWSLGRNHRLYISTSAGTLWFDKINQVWGTKDADIANINMDYVQNVCCQMALAAGYDKLTKVKEVVK